MSTIRDAIYPAVYIYIYSLSKKSVAATRLDLISSRARAVNQFPTVYYGSSLIKDSVLFFSFSFYLLPDFCYGRFFVSTRRRDAITNSIYTDIGRLWLFILKRRERLHLSTFIEKKHVVLESLMVKEFFLQLIIMLTIRIFHQVESRKSVMESGLELHVFNIKRFFFFF